jgi:hypothetical protein
VFERGEDRVDGSVADITALVTTSGVIKEGMDSIRSVSGRWRVFR